MVDRAELKEQCEKLGVQFKKLNESWVMRLACWYHKKRGNPFFETSTFVTFYPTIYTPNTCDDPFESDNWKIIHHELYHWERQKKKGVYAWIGCYLTQPYFREKEERPAFLRDIRNERLTLEQAVDAICGDLYGIKTLKEDMRSWFASRLG